MKQPLDNNGVGRNFVFVYLRLLGITILTFLTTRFSLQALGQSDFGLINVIGGIVVMMNVFNTAMMTTTRRYLNYEVEGDICRLNRVFNVCMVIHIGLAIVLLVAAETVGLLYIDFLLNASPEQSAVAEKVFHISVITGAWSVLNVPFQGILNAYEKFGVVAVFDVSRELIKCTLVYLLLFVECEKVLAYSWIMFGTAILSFGCYYLYSRVRWREIIRFSFCWEWSRYREILSFNNYVALGAGSCIINGQGRNLILNYFFGTLINGVYSIAYSVENFCVTIMANITTAVAPKITKSYSSGDGDRSYDLAILANRYSIITATGLFLLLNAELEFLMELWLGSVPEGALLFCRIMLLNVVIKSFAEGIPALSQATGRIKQLQLGILMIDIVALPLSCILFRYGCPPATILVVYSVISLVYCLYAVSLVRNVLSFDIRLLIRKSFIPSIKMVLVSGIILLMYGLLPCHNGILSIAGLLVLVIVYIVLVVKIGLNDAERKAFVYYFKHKRKETL